MSKELGITPRGENFAEWYNELVKRAELAENSPVRGSMVIRPHGYAIWELMQRALDDMFNDDPQPDTRYLKPETRHPAPPLSASKAVS